MNSKYQRSVALRTTDDTGTELDIFDLEVSAHEAWGDEQADDILLSELTQEYDEVKGVTW